AAAAAAERASRKQPAVCSKEISYRLCLSLRDCLSGTQALGCLELEGIRLRERDAAALGRGIAANSTLKSLSLESAKIGDVGVEHLCRALRHAGNVAFLNLSGNGLTWRAVDELGRLIGFQATSRHNEAWRDSLRYRRPNFDSMHGLRRIALNNNPLIDDQGAQVLADALKDDLWVKAIDLQGCGIGNAGAKSLLAVLKLNTTLVVLDLRRNHLIDKDLLHALTEQAGGGDIKCRRRVALSGPAGQLSVRRASADCEVAALSRAEAKATMAARRPFGLPLTGTEAGALSSGRRQPHAGQEPPGGEDQPHGHARTAADLDEPLRPRQQIVDEDDNFVDIDDEQSGDEEDATVVSPLVKEMEEAPPAPSAIKALKIELANQRRRLRRESACRQRADEEARRLRAENSALKRQLEQRIREAGRGGGASLLQDEELLESIETSFRRFHKFLDILRDAGLGRVVTAAGMDNLPSGLNLADRAVSTGAGPSAAAVESPGQRQQQQQQQRQPPRGRPAAKNPSPAARSKKPQQQQKRQQSRNADNLVDTNSAAVGADSLQFDDANGDEMYSRATRVKRDADQTYDRLRRHLQLARDQELLTGDQVLQDLGPSGQQPLLQPAAPSSAAAADSAVVAERQQHQPTADSGDAFQQRHQLQFNDFPDSDAEDEGAASRGPSAAAAAAAQSITPPPPPVLSPPSQQLEAEDAAQEFEEEIEEEDVGDTGRSGGGAYSYADSFDASSA
uniref:Response regulatory domain-containing protein n=1 Tax=Macrostomum lignano TaxID=282301 RepID=A0A1I8FTH2_9PLAT